MIWQILRVLARQPFFEGFPESLRIRSGVRAVIIGTPPRRGQRQQDRHERFPDQVGGADPKPHHLIVVGAGGDPAGSAGVGLLPLQ
jgi:hypothetical protein